jgi:hypothetical protein
MTPDEILERITPAHAHRLFTELEARDPNLYAATLHTLAQQRKLRPVFLQRKPKPERHEWLRGILAKKVNAGVAAQVLQVWLVACHAPMLCAFLDALGIAHDEDGTLQDLPTAPAPEAIRAAVDQLLAAYSPEDVRVYLHAFQALDENGGWPSLGDLLASDASLKL